MYGLGLAGARWGGGTSSLGRGGIHAAPPPSATPCYRGNGGGVTPPHSLAGPGPPYNRHISTQPGGCGGPDRRERVRWKVKVSWVGASPDQMLTHFISLYHNVWPGAILCCFFAAYIIYM